MNRSRLIGAWMLLFTSICAFAFYAYTVWYAFTNNFDEIVAPFVLFLIFAPLIPLFFIGIGGLALLACVEFAYRYLMRCYKNEF